MPKVTNTILAFALGGALVYILFKNRKKSNASATTNKDEKSSWSWDAIYPPIYYGVYPYPPNYNPPKPPTPPPTPPAGGGTGSSSGTPPAGETGSGTSGGGTGSSSFVGFQGWGHVK